MTMYIQELFLFIIARFCLVQYIFDFCAISNLIPSVSVVNSLRNRE